MSSRSFWRNEADKIRNDRSAVDTSELFANPWEAEAALVDKSGFRVQDGAGKFTYLYNGELFSLNGGNVKDVFVVAVRNAVISLWKSATARKIITKLQDSEEVPIVVKTGNESTHDFNTVTWAYLNPVDLPCEGGLKKDATIELVHELAHAYRFVMDLFAKDDGKFIAGTPLLVEEEEACHYENLIRAELKKPLRTHYNCQIPDNTPLDDLPKYHVLIMKDGKRKFKYHDYRNKR